MLLRGIQIRIKIVSCIYVLQMHVLNVGENFSQEEIGIEDSKLQKEKRAGEFRACQYSGIRHSFKNGEEIG